jgi:hypothetical protein
MPTWRNKPANRDYLNKRHTPAQQQALSDGAQRHAAAVLRRAAAVANLLGQKLPASPAMHG